MPPPVTQPNVHSAIDLRQVVKIYPKRVHALQGVNMQVGRGEIFGLVGPNGAGKSTLVKIMMTVVRPTRAEGTILGQRLAISRCWRRSGTSLRITDSPAISQGGRCWISSRPWPTWIAPPAGASRRVAGHRRHEPVGGFENLHLFQGMLQRVGLAQALVHDPDLIVLDEPTDGVDPVGRRDILSVLGGLRGKGKTVFINSHALSELESICDRVAILVKGQVARQGTIDELTVARQRYEIELVAEDHVDLRAGVLAAAGAQWVAQAGPPSLAPRIDRGIFEAASRIELEGPCSASRRPTRGRFSRSSMYCVAQASRSVACNLSGRRWKTCS